MLRNAEGIYRGFIIKNADPTGQHRVKVWVPAIHGGGNSNDLFGDPEEYVEEPKQEDSSILGVAKQKLGEVFDFEKQKAEYKAKLPKTSTGFKEYIAGTSASELAALEADLPWALVSQSLFGGGGSGYDLGGGTLTQGDGANFNYYSDLGGIGGGQLLDTNGKVEEDHLRSFLINEIRNTTLNGFVPEDGANFNVDGSAESWANFFVALCYKESDLTTSATGDAGRFNGGSRGLFQLSGDDATNWKLQSEPFSVAQLESASINTRATLQIASKIIKRDRVIYNPTPNKSGVKGRAVGLGRYWGPISRNQVKVPPVPEFTPTAPSTPSNTPPLPTDGSLELGNSASTATKTQKPAQSFSAPAGGYQVKNLCRDELGGPSAVRRMGRPISLDFNDTEGSAGAAGVMCVVPADLPRNSPDWVQVERYVQAVTNFFAKYSSNPKSGRLNSKPIQVSSSGRGLKSFIHTEPFDNDPDAAQAIMNHGAEYANILVSTLGKINNAVFLPPHEQGGNQGADITVNGRTYSETVFAKKFIIPNMAGASGNLIVDGFSAVGIKHPEETRDEAFLTEQKVDKKLIDELTKIGKEIYELKKDAKADPTGGSAPAIAEKKEQRDKIWDKIVKSKKDDENAVASITNHKNTNPLDYTPIPMNPTVNPASGSYAPNPYSNTAKGTYTKPNNGAPVWVMFEGSNLENPVVVGLNPDTAHIDSVTDIVNTPQDPNYDSTIRNSHSMVSRGGSVEMVDTVGNEGVNLVSHQGSSLSMNKFGTSKMVAGNDSKIVSADAFSTYGGDKNRKIKGIKFEEVSGDVTLNIGDIQACMETTKELLEQERPIHDKKRAFDLMKTNPSHPQDSSPHDKNASTPLPCKSCGTPVLTQNNKEGKMIGGKVVLGYKMPEFHIPSISFPKLTKPNPLGCQDCKGTGIELTSAGSVAPPNPIKATIPVDIANTTQERTRLENRLGKGGNRQINVSKSYILNAGGVMNDLPSIRVDTTGKKAFTGVAASPFGESVSKTHAAIPHIESVAVSNVGGGDITFSAANRISLIAGSNGVQMKTSGSLALQGRITTLGGDQVIISSNNTVLVDGGKNTTIAGDTVTIAPRDKKIGLDGLVGVSGNMTVRGGVHIEGELSVQHITAPVEYAQTEITTSDGFMVGGVIIGVTSDGQTVTSLPSPQPAVVSAHTHAYATLPLTLASNNGGVRTAGASAGQAPLVLAKPVSDTYNPLKNLGDFAGAAVDPPAGGTGGGSTPDTFLPKFNRFLQTVKFFDPNLFAFFDDCRDEDKKFSKLMDDIMLGNITKEEARKQFTKASDSPYADQNRPAQTEGSNECEDPCA